MPWKNGWGFRFGIFFFGGGVGVVVVVSVLSQGKFFFIQSKDILMFIVFDQASV